MSKETTDNPELWHRWYPDPDDPDMIDTFRVECGHHNGPECMKCHKTFCEHCDPHCYRYICPQAGQMEIDI